MFKIDSSASFLHLSRSKYTISFQLNVMLLFIYSILSIYSIFSCLSYFAVILLFISFSP